MKNIPIKERLALAQDEDTSEEILAILAQDADEDVLLAVWNNPSTAVDVREGLLTHPSDWLRQTIAEDPHLYESACVILSQDGNAGVRERIAENPNTPDDVRDLLEQDVLFTHEGVEYTRANLAGADLRWANMEGANLRDANMAGANLRGADLHGANLRDANLRDANLTEAYMEGANLRDANLRDANLTEAYMEGANLHGTVGLPPR